MRLEAYLLTEGRSKSITLDKAWDIIEKKCMQAAKAYYNDTATIYRGIMDRKDAMFVDPTSGKSRRSANTTNHYTLIVDNIPSWKNFPKRSESIICTTSSRRASNIGVPFAVFPYNGSKIGVLPTFDMWKSFKEINKLSVFNIELISLFERIGLTLVDKNWNTLKAAMKRFDKLIDGKRGEGNIREVVQDILKFPKGHYYPWLWLEGYNGNLLKTLDEVFDPISNGIELTTTGKSLPKDEKELWTNGKSVMINLLPFNSGEILKDRLKEIIT